MRTILFFTCLLLFSTTWGQEVNNINNSLIAFTIPEKDLLPENVAFDPNEKAFYVGSTRKGKIIKIDAAGKQSTFLEGGAFGQWMIIGMKVDSERNELWFCSSGGGNLVGYAKKDDTDGRPAGIFRVDLSTGKLIHKYMLEKPGEVHFFNDLVIAKNGDVYATHMFENPAIYKIAIGTDKLELFVESDLIKYPNGITMADNQSVLFVAHSEGLARIDIGSKQVTNLSVPDGVKVKHRESIDGLYYYKWSLIGVQADLHTVTRYFLNPDGDGIQKVETLDKDHPKMDHPTTGLVVGSEFYYVANAQFQKVNEDGSIQEELSIPTILKLKLK